MQANGIVDISINRLSSSAVNNYLLEFAGAVKRVFQDSTTKKTNNKESITIESLKKRRCIFMLSKRLVAFDYDHYNQLLCDHRNSYETVGVPLPSTTQAKYNESLASIARSYPKVTRDALERQKCSEPLRSVMRALPEDHKEGELRAHPVVAAVDAPATNLSRYMTGIVFPLIRSFIPPHIESTEEFISSIP